MSPLCLLCRTSCPQRRPCGLCRGCCNILFHPPASYLPRSFASCVLYSASSALDKLAAPQVLNVLYSWLFYSSVGGWRNSSYHTCSTP